MTETPAHDPAAGPEPTLEDIQDALVERLHAGEPVDRQELLDRYPQHREALAQFLEVVDLLEGQPVAERPTPSRLGEFRILREVGRGGMGVVYAAEQPSLRRTVALKVLPPALQNDRRLLARFRREAEAAARLQHPNIVPVHSFGESGGAPFFAMELVEGPSLADVLKKRRAGLEDGLPTEPDAWRTWCVETVAAVADALAYAHGRGVLHRDVKPGNVLVDAGGQPRLTDFGLALDMEATSLTVSGEVFGSPRYMSPEQAFRQQLPLDARTDVYSLAVTLYELLTLRLPYDAATSSEILMALEAGRLTPLREVDPGASPALEAVLAQALRLDPGKRYASAEAFAADLRAALSGGLVAAPRRGRWRKLAWAGGLLVVLWLSATALNLWLGEPEHFTPPPSNRDTVGLSAPDLDVVRRILAGPPEVDPGDPAAVARSVAVARENEAALKGWFRPRFDMRSVVARDAPAQVSFAMSGLIDSRWKDLGYEDVIAVATLELKVDDGEWFEPQGVSSLQIQLMGGASSFSHHGSFDLLTQIPDVLERDSFALDRRITLRVTRGAWGPDALGEMMSAHEFEGGSTAVWNEPTRTVFVYDSFPEDYPRAVSGEVLDACMVSAWTPYQASVLGTGITGPTGRSLEMRLRFAAYEGEQLAPLAGHLELLAEDGETVLARAELENDPEPPADEDERPSLNNRLNSLHLSLPERLDGPQQRTLLDLTDGSAESIRLRFVSDRAVAAGSPTMESYWSGSFEVDVPLVDPATQLETPVFKISPPRAEPVEPGG